MEFLDQYVTEIITALILLALLVIALLAWRAISPRVQGRRGQRLGISEYHELDKMRRLVLVRRDNVEHLILIGGPQDLVVESGITVPSFSPPYETPADADVAPRSARPAPRPPVFGDSKPPVLRSGDPLMRRDPDTP